MCGIAGVIALDPSRIPDPVLFGTMNDQMIHRGPDGEGFLLAGQEYRDAANRLRQAYPKAVISQIDQGRHLLLGHRRLSIIDLDVSAGQPMSDSEGDIWLVFNGEIYNHIELRKRLEAAGHRFRTHHSDTETIIYAYKEWGRDFIHELRGMFALCLWDKRNDYALFVRDRIGIKPLYYTVQNGCLYFASEIKVMLADPAVKRSLNLRGFYDYLTFLTVPAPETLFEGIYKLKPGHLMEVIGGRVRDQQEYWDVYDHVNFDASRSESEIGQELVAQLRESVSLRLQADVPVGIFLSGGIDSSLNATLFSEIAQKEVKAFSVGYPSDHELKSYTNEFEYARRVAKGLKADYHEYEISEQDFMEFLPKLVFHQDEPIADPVCVPVYFVSKLARDNGVTVCQVGEGSDELFWGYAFWKKFLKLQQLNDLPVPSFLKRMGLGAMQMAGKDNEFLYEVIRRGINDEKQLFWAGLSTFGEQEKRRLVHPDILSEIKDYNSWEAVEPYWKKFNKVAPEKTMINWMSYIDLKIRLPELLLMRVDKMSMAVSLEARVPFLDHKFVEFAMGIPSELKSKNMVNKYILKKSIEGILEDDIIYRKKQGFGAPVMDWFLQDLGRMAKEELHTFTDQQQFLNKEAIDRYFREEAGEKLWYLLNFSMWWKNYLN